jgi:hypothetical protein
MTNPWTKLESGRNGYVLDEELGAVEDFNLHVGSSTAKILFDALPEPYIGNPDSAKVVLLGLNPGYSASDPYWHAKEDFRRALLLNLKHELKEYPFYPLNPAFRESGTGQWWRQHTAQLKDASGLDEPTFAERIMVIEWFPYHSVSFKVSRVRFPSQRYSFDLAGEMLRRNRLLVGMRSKQLWTEVDTKLGDIPYPTRLELIVIGRAMKKETIEKLGLEARLERATTSLTLRISEAFNVLKPFGVQFADVQEFVDNTIQRNEPAVCRKFGIVRHCERQ